MAKIKSPQQVAVQKLASKIAKAEGRKVQISIGNVREVIRLVNEEFDGAIYKMAEKKFS